MVLELGRAGAVLPRLGRVLPTFRLQQRRDPRVVVQPHSEIEVMVCSGDRSGVEIDRPATEQPVLDSMIECELAAALFATTGGTMMSEERCDMSLLG